MRDGCVLVADVHRPARQTSPLPAALLRTPYGRATPQRLAIGAHFAQHGYACVIQDVRGRYDSEGCWRPFLDEPLDGYDTIEWVARQPWCDGRVGTFGSSYSGSIQSAAATLNPPHLRAMVIAAGAANCWQATMRHHGALELRWIVYILSMAVNSREARADPLLADQLQQQFDRATEWLISLPSDISQSSLRHLPSYQQWLADLLQHRDYDDYWRQRCFAYDEYVAEHADVPTLYFGGWYDTYAGATCGNYRTYRQAKHSPQAMMMGPWQHEGWSQCRAGELDFGSDAAVDFPNVCRQWFDQHLKQLECPSPATVRFFLMGGSSGQHLPGGAIDHGGQWRNASSFPPPNVWRVAYYLHAGGRLSPDRPLVSNPCASFTFDPNRPVPTLGGCNSGAGELIPAGGFNQQPRANWWYGQDLTPLDQRCDVLIYQTAPLPEPLELIGPIRVVLFVTSTAPDTDFVAKLIDVYPAEPDHPDPVAINLTDGILRTRYRDGRIPAKPMQPGVVYRLEWELFPTANLFAAGHCIRLDISSSNFPRFDVNGGSPHQHRSDRPPIHQTVFLDQQRPSHVVLSVAPGDAHGERSDVSVD